MYEGVDTNIAHERNKAVAFLFTIGAKALVLEEHSKLVCSSAGMEEEALMKQEIDREERIRNIRQESLDRLQVFKISRSGQIRMLYIKFYFENHRTGGIRWKSMWKFKKLFVLDRSLQVTIESAGRSLSAPASASSSSSPSSASPSSVIAPLRGGDESHLLKSVTFLKFRNRSRYLIIGFSHKEEMQALLEIIRERLPSAALPDFSTI